MQFEQPVKEGWIFISSHASCLNTISQISSFNVHRCEGVKIFTRTANLSIQAHVKIVCGHTNVRPPPLGRILLVRDVPHYLYHCMGQKHSGRQEKGLLELKEQVLADQTIGFWVSRK